MTVDPKVVAKLLSAAVSMVLEYAVTGQAFEELVKLLKNAEAQNRDITYEELKPYIERSKEALEAWEKEISE